MAAVTFPDPSKATRCEQSLSFSATLRKNFDLTPGLKPTSRVTKLQESKACLHTVQTFCIMECNEQLIQPDNLVTVTLPTGKSSIGWQLWIPFISLINLITYFPNLWRNWLITCTFSVQTCSTTVLIHIVVMTFVLLPLLLELRLTHHQVSAGASESLSYHHTLYWDTERSHISVEAVWNMKGQWNNSKCHCLFPSLFDRKEKNICSCCVTWTEPIRAHLQSTSIPWFYVQQAPSTLSTLNPPNQNLTVSMERVQHMTKSAIRRASQIEVNPQAKRNLQELFVNFTLILICLLLIYIIVLLSSWEQQRIMQREFDKGVMWMGSFTNTCWSIL